MGSFRRAFLGYQRSQVDEAVASRDARVSALERELAYLSGIVLEREREIRDLQADVQAANDRHHESMRSLESVSKRLEEIHAQARGQATRIRMKALHEAVEVTKKVQDLVGRIGLDPVSSNGADAARANGKAEREPAELFQGLVRIEVGPLGDFSQLLGFEDAAAKIGATSEISVERFSEGRATLAMRLEEPVDLLRELEERSPHKFKIRHAASDRVVLDLDDEAQAA